MKAIRLKTEHLYNPVGVDYTAPRLYWNCEGSKRQTAYQLIATDDKNSILWDSGRVESNSMCAKWGGSPVAPKTRVFWKLRLWDENNTPGEWSEASFKTCVGAWSAKWISGDYKVNKKNALSRGLLPQGFSCRRRKAGASLYHRLRSLRGADKRAARGRFRPRPRHYRLPQARAVPEL